MTQSAGALLRTEISAPGLQSLREAFLTCFPKFVDFREAPSDYWKEERRYKDLLIDFYHANLDPLQDSEVADAASARQIIAAVLAVLTRTPPGGSPQNLLNWRAFDFLRRSDLGAEKTMALAGAFHDLLFGPDDSAERLERFNVIVWPIAAEYGMKPSVTRSLPTLFLMLADPTRDVYVSTSILSSVAKTLLIAPLFDNGPLSASQYRRVQGLMHLLFDELRSWGWHPRDLIDVQSFIWSATWKDPMTASPPSSSPSSGKNPFEALLASLAAEGLYFPVEMVSNYLLALQAKRFVILTGISGTGKTRLALEVAKHFRRDEDVRSPVEPPTDAVRVFVRPYMLKYNRIVIPVAITGQMRIPPIDPMSNGGKMQTVVDEVVGSSTFWRDPNRNVTVLLFGGEQAARLKTREIGDPLFLSVIPDQGEGGDGLRITMPALEVVPGKTKNYEVIAVQPDWMDSRGLLGFYNQLTERYTSTPFLDLLLRAREDEIAAENEGREVTRYFAILDEMNLARVEQYFADFLSCLESGEALHLHDNLLTELGEDAGERAVPRTLVVPRNLFFTGTVNVDETTYMFSPKVLDRAFTIEFNDVSLAEHGRTWMAPAMDGQLALMAMPEQLELLDRPGADDWNAFRTLDGGLPAQIVMDLHGHLAPLNRHFGYRVANEIARFVNLAMKQSATADTPSAETLMAALDLALLQKVLPKFSGTAAELSPLMDKLCEFTKADGSLPDGVSIVRLPHMARKVERMRDQLRRQGFTSFIQ